MSENKDTTTLGVLATQTATMAKKAAANALKDDLERLWVQIREEVLKAAHKGKFTTEFETPWSHGFEKDMFKSTHERAVTENLDDLGVSLTTLHNGCDGRGCGLDCDHGIQVTVWWGERAALKSV